MELLIETKEYTGQTVYQIQSSHELFHPEKDSPEYICDNCHERTYFNYYQIFVGYTVS